MRVFTSSTRTEPYWKYSGKKCELVRMLTSDEVDLEAGIMYLVRFEDGKELEVFADEIRQAH